jgi:glutamine synthetase
MNAKPDKAKDVKAAAALAELDAFLASHPKVSALDCLFIDQTGTIRGKRIPKSEARGVFEGGMQMSFSAFLLDARGELTNPQGRGFGDGDPDGTALPVPDTLTQVAFADPPRGQVLMSLQGADGKPAGVDPREVLRRVVERFRELELSPVVAVELEFYLIDPARTPDGRIQPPLCPREGARERAISVYGIDDLDRYRNFLTAVREACAIQQVPATAANSEYGPGQFEINLRHTNDPMRACDQAIFLKQCISAAALKSGARATFMSKPYADRAGSGMHIHLSLQNRSGKNVFDNGTSEGSEQLRFAASGLGAMMHEGMAIFAQNPNAFRRYVRNLFVPMNRRWGVNNRSTGIRVPAGPDAARRLEHRVAGADANPYLVVAAVLAGVHHGLKNKIDAGPPFPGNAADYVDPSVPFTSHLATEALKTGTILRAYLGDYVDLYVESKQKELERFRAEITPHEYDWFL